MKTQFMPLLMVALAAAVSSAAEDRGRAEHVVIVVWDGLRPDFITPQYAPTLYGLAKRGTYFRRNHSAYVSSTEVNGTALATGMQPDHSGIIANTQYRRELGWSTSYGTENLDAIRRADLLSQNRFLEAPTVAETLQEAGIATVIAGTKPVALLHDRSGRKTSAAARESVTLYHGLTLPRSTLEALVKIPEIGPFPVASPRPLGSLTGTNAPDAAESFTNLFSRAGSRRDRGPSGNPDTWTVRALTRGLWRKSVPAYSLLWLSEPDASQHAFGPGSEAAIAALAQSDDHLATVLKALEEKGVLDTTDIFVVSDHGFSTVNHGFDALESMKRLKFSVEKQFQDPEAGDILLVNLGGSAFFYVFDHDEATIQRLVEYLQATDFCGVIFSSLPIDGTFSLEQGHLNISESPPDVVVSMRWTSEMNDYGVAGMLAAIEGKRGTGAHGSLSRFDLHNAMAAAGPDFRKEFVDDLPTGNIDVAPTVLSILGVQPARRMDGRVLLEAMTSRDSNPIKPVQQTLEASRNLGFREWRQYLEVIEAGGATYFDEGNGGSKLE